MIRTSRITGPRSAPPLSPLDQRDHAWRPDLADIALAGQVTAPNYAAPMVMQAARQVALLSADNPAAPAASELLPGEGFAVLDIGHGYAWGYALADGYVGHVAEEALAPVPEGAEAMVGPADALLFCRPAVKAAVGGTLPLGARVRFEEADDRFVRLTAGPGAGHFLHRRHLLPASGDPALDWVEVALGFRGAPYRWGGRSRAGVDCSGLIQVARQLAGQPCRRDSDMICADARAATGAGADVPAAQARRGDIAWWPGHIGILLDPATLLHANGHWMACVVEPLAAVVARAEAAGGPALPRLRRF